MDTKSEIRDFLTSRRARIAPEDVGLPVFGGMRRVPGLRREEVATLAGVSVDYYNRMERGNLAGASDTVLEALSRALKLDQAERSHLFDLARASQAGRPRRSPGSRRATVRPSVQWMLDAMTGAAAFVQNGRLDILGSNQLGRAFYSELFSGEPSSVALNWARFIFLDPRSMSFYADWNRAAKECAALLRMEAGRDPYDRGLTDLVGELSTQSQAFRTHWASHDVRLHHKGIKHFVHPMVGELELSYDRVELAADPGVTILAYTAEPGSRSAEAFGLLGSWAASSDEPAPAESPGT